MEVFVELLPEKVVNSSKTKVIKKKGHPEEYETTTTKTVTTTVVRRVRRVPIEAEAEPEVEEPASPGIVVLLFCLPILLSQIAITFLILQVYLLQAPQATLQFNTICTLFLPSSPSSSDFL